MGYAHASHSTTLAAMNTTLRVADETVIGRLLQEAHPTSMVKRAGTIGMTLKCHNIQAGWRCRNLVMESRG